MFYQKDLTAVDMGSSCIKILSYKKQGKKYYLNQQPVVEGLSRGVIQQGQILDVAELKNIFKQIHGRTKYFSKTKRCALSINSGAVIVRRMEVLGTGKEEDFGARVRQHAEQLISHFDSLYWGYSIIGEGVTPDSRAVVVSAAKIEVVETYLSIIHSVGMKVGVMDTAITCISNMFCHNYRKLPGFHMIIDMGSSSSNIVCVLDGMFCFSRTIILGGDAYSTALSSDLGVDHDRAENLKVNLNKDNISAQVSKSLQNVHDSVASEVNTSLDYFNRGIGLKIGIRELDSVFLIGGGSRTPGLLETISRRCNVSVSHLDPFKQVVSRITRSAYRDLMSVNSFFGVTSGLGMRRVGD